MAADTANETAKRDAHSLSDVDLTHVYLSASAPFACAGGQRLLDKCSAGVKLHAKHTDDNAVALMTFWSAGTVRDDGVATELVFWARGCEIAIELRPGSFAAFYGWVGAARQPRRCRHALQLGRRTRPPARPRAG